MSMRGGARVFEEDVHIRCVRLHHHEHLCACERLEAVQVECVGLQQLYAGAAGRRGQLRCNCMQGVPAPLLTLHRSSTLQIMAL